MQTEEQQQPTLEQIAANPDALANMTDEQLDALANQDATGGSQVIEGDNIGSGAPAVAGRQKEESQAIESQDPPKGIQAKDGNHIIPYSVLERERDRAARAVATAEALSEQLQQLQQGNGKATGDAGDTASLTLEDLDQLDEDLPGVAKVIRAQMAAIDKLTGNLADLQRDRNVDAQVKQQSVQDEIEAAIAATPALAAWRSAAESQESPDPLMWNRAADLDAVLRQDPAWADRPVSERFAKVAETIGNLYGAPPVTSAAPSNASTQATNLKAKADAAIAAADKASKQTPRSLSDIPGGSAPLVDEAAALLDKTGPELTTAFMAMTPEQIEAKLARLR